MHKSLISKFFILLLVVGLLAGATGQAKAADIDVNAPITRAANQLVATQMKSGGWGQDELTSPTNIGPAGIGLALAYERIEDQAYYNALFGKDPDNGVADYLLSKTDNFAPGDGLIAFYLDQIENVKTYSEFVNTNYFQKLADGTYNGMGYDAYLPTLQASAYQWLNSEDVATGMLSAFLVGADYKPWSQAVFNTLDSIVAGQGMEFLVVSKSIFALQFVGETTFVPSNGAYYGLSLYNIASQVVAYQMSNGAIPTDSDWNTEEDILATIFTILAIDKIDATTFNAKIEAAVQWLITTQDSDGDFVGGPLLSKNSGTNGLAIWALDEAYPAVPAEVLCTTACYVSPTGSDTAMGNEATPFATIQKAVTTVVPGGTVHVAAGTYTENLLVDTALTLQGVGTNWEAKIVGTIGIRASNVTLQGLDISNPGFVAGINLSNDQLTPRLTLSHISILNNKIHDIGGYAGGNTKAIKAAHGPDNVTIEGNQFYNITNTSYGHSDAISFGDTAATDPSTGVVIRNNTFENITSAQKAGNAISINNKTGVAAVIEGNTFAMDTISGAPSYLYATGIGLGGPTPDTIIRSNTFNGAVPSSTFAIALGPSAVVIERNKFLSSGNLLASATLADASVNWWGAPTGPAAGQIIYGPVGYVPWCLDAECTKLAGPVHNETQDTWFGTIQAAINAANANDVIQVAAGTFNENVVINKNGLTLRGAFALNPNDVIDPLVHTIINSAAPASATLPGIKINTGITGVTISNLRVQNFSSNSGVYGEAGNNGLTISHVHTYNNNTTNAVNGGGIYMNGPVSNVSITYVDSQGNKARGIVIWNGFKQNITFSNNYVANNSLCGIELQDGTASGVTVTGNTVIGNGDSGIGLIGLTSGAGANLISGNTVTNNGRFGIEIKLPNGSGLTTGDGSIIVETNTVSLPNPGADLRDFAGIAVYRRGWVAGSNNVDIPTGVIVRNNTVSDYKQSSTSTGFGIVVEGNKMTVSGNTLNNNDVGVQVQAGHLPYTANTNVDGDQTNVADDYFGRGNSPVACVNVANDNVYSANGVDYRTVGAAASGSPSVTNLTTGATYCTIQAAIDAASAGNTISVAAGTYVEELVIDKSVTLLGPNADINPNTGTRVEEAVIKSSVDGAVITQVTGVSIKGFTFDGQGTSDSAIYAYDGAGSVVIENNILMNHDYGALVFYNYTNSGGVTTNNIIKNNKIETVTGTYGLGMLLYNNFYAEVTGNVISDVRVGIQTGNYYRANTGAPATLSDNQITANRRGIFHNLHYSDASAFTITGNIIIAQDLATGTTFDGIMLSSLQTAVDAIVTNNTITIGDITQSPTTGYMIWNNPTTATLSVEGGTVSGADYGVWVNNYEGYSSNADNTSVTIDGVTINGAGIGVYVKDSLDNTNGATVTAIIKNNTITATTGIKVEGADATASGDHNMVYATTDVENTNPVSMNFENNYWGSPCGATVVGVVDTIPWFEDEAMLVSKETNPSGNLTLTPDMTTLAINNTLACAAPYSTITFTTTTEDVEYPGNIIIPEGRDHLKIVLTDGVKIQATSPCFTVEADYTTIKAENIGMAACVTAAGSNGIDVADGVVNLTVDGLEIYGPGNDGIHFNGVITDVVLKDNLIHDLAGNGVFFGAQPVAQTLGAIDIHGNMFQNNALKGIEAGAFIVPAEYNSWGNVTGAAAGDGASSGVGADPFTHVDLYLESSGTPWANQAVSGQTITYTVMGHLVNASGAEFTLTYPENLTYVTSSAGTTFGLDSVTHTAGTRSLHFMGYSTTGNKTGTLPLFNVTFTAGTPVVAAPMLLDELTDGFAMAGVGSSANIYAAALLDSSVTIVTLPTVSSTDIQGYYLSGEQREFSVVLDNPSTGADYTHVYVDFTIANAQIAEFGTVEYSVDGGTTWVALGVGPGTSIANDGANIVGYFGKVTGGGFALAPDASLTTLFRVTFPTREQGATDFPTSYAVTMQLMDADALPSALMLDDFSDTMYVYDKPTITSTDIQGYYLTGEEREFHVTGANPLTGKNYSNVMYKITLPNTVTDDITNIQYYETYPTTGYVPLALTQDGANVVAWFGLANYGGFPMAPGFSDSPSFLVTFATAKEYSVLIEQYDVALDPDRLLVAETFTANVYTPPVITATFPTGPYAAGVPVTVDVDITNPSSIPAPFELVFDLPAGTVISYGGTDYVCAATCPPIEVTLPLVDGQFSITFDEAWTGTAGLSLFDSDWTSADRLLATASQTGVVVNDDFAVTGTFSMQGRSTRAGIPVTLTWGGALGPYANSADTIDAISNNFSLTLTYGGTYTVTTAQPRYLNVTTANAKTLSVPLALGKTMNPLELKAGNAKWDDNIINDQDSGMIASGYIQGITLFPNADVNFDNKINIQDLALVGGNYFVDSTVYNSWIVVTP